MKHGKCPACGKSVAVKKDGTARKHRRGSKPSRPCFGSGRAAVEVFDMDEKMQELADALQAFSQLRQVREVQARQFIRDALHEA